MAINQCPLCAGEGWVSSGPPLSELVHAGLIQYQGDDRQVIRVEPATQIKQEQIDYLESRGYLRDGEIDGFSLHSCFCNQPVIQLAQESGPLHYRDDPAEVSAVAVDAFLDSRKETLGPVTLYVLKAYITQWTLGVVAMARIPAGENIPMVAWFPALAMAETRQDIQSVLYVLNEWGIDPLKDGV